MAPPFLRLKPDNGCFGTKNGRFGGNAMLLSTKKAYHKKGNLILIRIAIPVLDEPGKKCVK